MQTEVKFTCPKCGVEWTEWQDTDDEWYRLATNETLCDNCGREAVRRLRENGWRI